MYKYPLLLSFLHHKVIVHSHSHDCHPDITSDRDSKAWIGTPYTMSRELIDKSILQSKLASLRLIIAMKDDKPANREEYHEDRALNQRIREAAQEIRQHRYFEDIIIEGGTHDDFLDGWEHLESFTVHRWSLPYEYPTRIEWDLEIEGLQEVQAMLRGYKVVGAM